MLRDISLVAAFAAMVPLANWMIGHVGACFPGGPCVIPVWPGIMAPSGVLAIGMAFVLRDLVQRRMGRAWGLGAIALGAAVSVLVAPPAIAVASIAAYLVSELADFTVYTMLIGTDITSRGLVVAVAVSGLFSATLDSVTFLQIGFGSLAFFPGQLLGKAWSIAAALPVVAGLRRA